MSAQLLDGLVIDVSGMRKNYPDALRYVHRLDRPRMTRVNPTGVAGSGNIHPIISTIRTSWREFTFTSPLMSMSSSIRECITANEWIIWLLFTVEQFIHAMIDGHISTLHQRLVATLEQNSNKANRVLSVYLQPLFFNCGRAARVGEKSLQLFAGELRE
jgi:hypothetical protein